MGAVKVLGPLCKNRHRYRGIFKSLRYSSTRQCVKCQREWVRQYSALPHVRNILCEAARKNYWKNREKRLIQMRKYHNTPAFLESSKRSHQKHREKRNAETRLWKEKNRGRVSEYNRQYIQTPHGKNVVRKIANNRRTRRGFIPYTPLQLQRRMSKLGNKCIYCGSAKNITVDHLVPLALDGFECLTNLVPACRLCNTRKNKIHPLVWIERLPNCDHRLRRRVSRLVTKYKLSIRGKAIKAIK